MLNNLFSREHSKTKFMPNKRFEAGDIIFNENDEADGLYYICSGRVEISHTVEGDKKTLAILTEGGAFGEMALIDEKPRSATVTALEETWVYVVTTKNFKHKFEQLDTTIQDVLRMLTQIIRNNNDAEKASI